jgi:hypothetical protein
MRKKRKLGAGRPAVLGVPRDKTLTLKMSAAELESVTRLAGELGLERSELVRRAIEIVVANPKLLRPVETLRPERYAQIYESVLHQMAAAGPNPEEDFSGIGTGDLFDLGE